MIQPLVSIVMCSYNEDTLLKDAIESVLAQDYAAIELIILDDASPNLKTHEILRIYENHPKVTVYFNKVNRGYLKNKNFAISKANGEYITQLDNDDFIASTKVSRQLEVLEKMPEIKIIGCGYFWIDGNGQIVQKNKVLNDILIDKPEGVYPFWFPSLLVHRSVYKDLGYFNEYFDGTMGDDYYWTVVANMKFPIYHIADCLYYYRFNPNSITNVLNNERKMIAPLVLKELVRQHVKTSTDWLQQQAYSSIKDYEKKIKENKSLMAEQYRIWAAKAIDKNDFYFAKKLLLKSFWRFPFSVSLVRTFFYLLKK